MRGLVLLGVELKAGVPFHEAVVSCLRLRGPLGNVFGKALRRTLLGCQTSLEQAVEDEMGLLPERLDWVGRAVRDQILAMAEPDLDRRDRLLNHAFASALNNCRQEIKEAISGIRVPVSTIFALGIVLPIVIATMIPLLGTAYSNPAMTDSTSDFSGQHLEEAEASLNILALPAASILAFPIISVLSSLHIISNRAIVSGEGLCRSSALRVITILLAGNLLYAVLLISEIQIPLWISIGCIIVLSLVFGLLTWKCANGDRIGIIYRSPHVLTAISSRLRHGEHFVRAVISTRGDSGESRRLFWASMCSRVGKPSSKPWFDDEMIRMINESSANDPNLAAEVLGQVANHLEDLESIEKEMRHELRPVGQSIMIATLFLSPFVLGIAAGFGTSELMSMSNSIGPQDIGNLFILFISEMVIVGGWLVRVMNRDDVSSYCKLAEKGIAIPISMAIFALALMFSRAMFS